MSKPNRPSKAESVVNWIWTHIFSDQFVKFVFDHVRNLLIAIGTMGLGHWLRLPQTKAKLANELSLGSVGLGNMLLATGSLLLLLALGNACKAIFDRPALRQARLAIFLTYFLYAFALCLAVLLNTILK